MILSHRDLELINSVSKLKFNSIDDVTTLPKEDVLDIIELLGNLIGYDSEIDDIDAIGLEADNAISKLLLLLEKRGEM